MQIRSRCHIPHPGVSSVMLSVLMFPLNVNSQESSGRIERQRTEQQSAEKSDRSRASESDSGDSPMLGVRVLPTPGEGVLVVSRVWGSPAHDAGIREGDFIVAVDGTTVSTPAELKATIEKSQPNSKVRFKVWRNEESFTKEIQLAQRSDEVPECHRAWLGVVLTSARRSNGTGVELAHVFPNSPAEQSGLQQGDVILKADDRDVSNIDSLLQCMENHGPDAACVLAVERNGEVQNIPIKLGNLDRAPYEWMVNAFRAPLDATELNDTQNDDNRVDGDVRELIQSLRQEVAELRQQIEKPAGIESRDPSRDRSGEQPRQNAQPGERPNDRNSRIEDARTKVQLVAVASPSPTPQTVTVQQNRQYRGQGNRYYPPTNNNYRYGYRDYSMGRYPNNSGWYYNYGGSSRYAPSYNRGAYFYGPRFGVRVGPSWGTYWY